MKKKHLIVTDQTKYTSSSVKGKLYFLFRLLCTFVRIIKIIILLVRFTIMIYSHAELPRCNESYSASMYTVNLNVVLLPSTITT